MQLMPIDTKTDSLAQYLSEAKPISRSRHRESRIGPSSRLQYQSLKQLPTKLIQQVDILADSQIINRRLSLRDIMSHKQKVRDQKACNKLIGILGSYQQPKNASHDNARKQPVSPRRETHTNGDTPTEAQKKEKLIKAIGNKQCFAVAQLVCQNIKIYQELFAGSPGRLMKVVCFHGWDDSFASVFSRKPLQKDERITELKTDLHPDDLIAGLGLNRNSFVAKNLFKKLSLFARELSSANARFEELECRVLRQKLSVSLNKITNKVSAMRKSQDPFLHSYLEQISQTHRDLINRKLRIKDRGPAILEIVPPDADEVTSNRVNMFREKNLGFIENYHSSR